MSTSFALTYQGATIDRIMIRNALYQVTNTNHTVLEMHTCFSANVQFIIARFSPPAPRTVIESVLNHISECLPTELKIECVRLFGFQSHLLTDEELVSSPLGPVIRKTILKAISRNSFYDSPDLSEIHDACMLFEPNKNPYTNPYTEDPFEAQLGMCSQKERLKTTSDDLRQRVKAQRERMDERHQTLRGM